MNIADKILHSEPSKYRPWFRDVFYLLLIGYVATNYYFHSSIGIHWFLYLAGCGFVYFLTKGLITINSSIESIIRIALIIWGIMEAVQGLLQLYGFAESNNSLYNITGSFQNPGPYAGFLAVIVPIALHCALNPPQKNKLSRQIAAALSLAGVFLILIILPATLSRGAWLAAATGGGIVLIFHYQVISRIKRYVHLHHKRAVIYSVAAFFVFGGMGTGIYFLKKDSADGRLLMWKVTTHIIAGHPITGVGPGHFAGAYGQAQAEYFSKGQASRQEEYVAGSPEYAFNEFLQIAAENGLPCLFLFLLIVLWGVTSASKSKQFGISGSLAAFLTFACFSYPFSIWQFNILFVILLAIAGTRTVGEKQKTKSKNRKIIALGITLVIFAIPIIWQSKAWSKRQQAMTQWQEEQTYYNMEIYEETVDHYRKLYVPLRDEPKFLFELGQCLSKTGFYEESNQILRQGAGLSSDPMFWNIMGKNNQAMLRFEEAEECYIHACQMVPHRLYPLYLLANLYFLSGQHEKATAMAKRVISQEPKITSTAIEEMKTEMKEKLSEKQATR